MKNKIEDLRNHLFATLEALQDEKKPMDIERAKAVAEVATVLVNSAKVEVEHMKITNSVGSGFMPDNRIMPKPAPAPAIEETRVRRISAS